MTISPRTTMAWSRTLKRRLPPSFTRTVATVRLRRNANTLIPISIVTVDVVVAGEKGHEEPGAGALHKNRVHTQRSDHASLL